MKKIIALHEEIMIELSKQSFKTRKGIAGFLLYDLIVPANGLFAFQTYGVVYENINGSLVKAFQESLKMMDENELMTSIPFYTDNYNSKIDSPIDYQDLPQKGLMLLIIKNKKENEFLSIDNNNEGVRPLSISKEGEMY